MFPSERCGVAGNEAIPSSRTVLCSPPKDEDLQTKRRYRQSVPHNVPPPKDEDLQGKRRYRQSVPRNVAFRKMRICRQRGGTVKPRLAMFLLAERLVFAANGLYFNQAVLGKGLDRYGTARGIIARKVLAINFVHSGKVVHIRQKAGRFNHVF